MLPFDCYLEFFLVTAAEVLLSGYARLRELVPVLGVWDDHDYGLNNGGKEFQDKERSQVCLREPACARVPLALNTLNSTSHVLPLSHSLSCAQDIFLNFLEEPADSPRRAHPGIYASYLLGPPGKRYRFVYCACAVSQGVGAG